LEEHADDPYMLLLLLCEPKTGLNPSSSSPSSSIHIKEPCVDLAMRIAVSGVTTVGMDVDIHRWDGYGYPL
jgi:hypothetical protein